jgi:hypothetical protein
VTKIGEVERLICRKIDVKMSRCSERKGEDRRNVEEETYLTECVTKDKSGIGRGKKNRAKGSVCEGRGLKSEISQNVTQGWVVCVSDEIMQQKGGKSQTTRLSIWTF